jgi:hypothetical protein
MSFSPPNALFLCHFTPAFREKQSISMVCAVTMRDFGSGGLTGGKQDAMILPDYKKKGEKAICGRWFM